MCGRAMTLPESKSTAYCCAPPGYFRFRCSLILTASQLLPRAEPLLTPTAWRRGAQPTLVRGQRPQGRRAWRKGQAAGTQSRREEPRREVRLQATPLATGPHLWSPVTILQKPRLEHMGLWGTSRPKPQQTASIPLGPSYKEMTAQQVFFWVGCFGHSIL